MNEISFIAKQDVFIIKNLLEINWMRIFMAICFIDEDEDRDEIQTI